MNIKNFSYVFDQLGSSIPNGCKSIFKFDMVLDCKIYFVKFIKELCVVENRIKIST